MKTLREYGKKTYIGTVDNEKIYLSAPSWDCGWYWGFGYLGNQNCHYHVDGMSKGKNLYDAFRHHFGNSLIVRESDLWQFAELFSSFYALKKTAEVLGRGGSHFTGNPCKDIIINKVEVDRINNIVLPAIFDEIYKILDRNKDNQSVFNELVKLNIEGDTNKVIKYMNEKCLKPDDLNSIDGISKHDYHVIHGFWYADYHTKRKQKH
jgi:hypothetical protein